MITMGLDTGTTSGCGVLRGDQLIYAGAHHCEGEDDGQIFTSFRVWWLSMLNQFQPDEVAIEEPLRTDLTKQSQEIIKGQPVTVMKPIGTMRTFLRLYGLRAHAVQICGSSRLKTDREKAGLAPLKYREINNKSWRSVVYAKDQPPRGTTDTSKWWKERALQQCRLLRWPIESKDAAEAAMIADWLRITVKTEKYGAPKPPPPVDLFNPAPPIPERTETSKEERPF